MGSYPVVIIGAGPAGLAAGYELTRRGVRCLLLEKSGYIGGLSRTEVNQGYRFDVGGHRFYSGNDEAVRIWKEMLGDDLLTVARRSRICYKGRFFHYPLDLFNVLGNLGGLQSGLILLSFLGAKILPHRREETFQQWVTNRFGHRLYRDFFQAYTEKVWGIPCSQLSSDWAAQRIGGMSMITAIRSALFGANGTRTLVQEFYYPMLGSGQMWERFAAAIAGQGGHLHLNREVVSLRRRDDRVCAVTIREGDRIVEIQAENVISSMPLTGLIPRIQPAPSDDVLAAAGALRHRSFIQVSLIVKGGQAFADNWLYVHDPEVRVGRIQNYRNWSIQMTPDASGTCLGMEYFCNEGDDLWCQSDEALAAMAKGELAYLGLARGADVQGGAVIREAHAYPVYDRDYRANLDTIRHYLASLSNFQTIGRSGMHRYNNQDHSMLSGLMAARNLLGCRQDVWTVNTERSYGEGRPPHGRQ
jgi:protoporphyrinogen oxidase